MKHLIVIETRPHPDGGLEERESVLSEENARLRRLLNNARVGLWAAAESARFQEPEAGI